MHTLRKRISALTICGIVVAVAVVTLLSVLFIRKNERRNSEQLLLLLCETGAQNLDYYFTGVQKSVGKAAAFVEEDLDGLETEQLQAHMDRVEGVFRELAYQTNGVLTYYYRIDPAVSDTVKGFWYTNLDGQGFTPRAVTDITLYDTEDTSALVWFTVPRETGESIWQPPYITENLNERVISYNVPVYFRGVFVGVVGIEIDYTTMAKQVESIHLYSTGDAFLVDGAGKLMYHPHIDVAALPPEALPAMPDGLMSDSTFTRYTYDGVEKQAVWLPLSNGMRLYVSAPVAETEGQWRGLIREIVIASAAVLLAMGFFMASCAGRMTRPLEELTEAAELVSQGKYSAALDYSGDDEIGRLTAALRQLVERVRGQITDEHRDHVDALTAVRSKGAFDDAVEKLQTRLEKEGAAFAIGVFDCDDLKTVNEQYGRDKGDLYLRTACSLICRVFQHSPVFRIGSDEFAVILQNRDYEERDALVEQFERTAREMSAATENLWEQVHMARGVAVYDPQLDLSATDTVRRADRLMYLDQRRGKDAP